MNSVLFRADASASIGTGHVMRCLGLASVLRARGLAVAFAGKVEPPALAERILAAGCEYLGENSLRRPGGGSPPGPPDFRWVIFDGYHYSSEDYGAYRRAGVRVLAVDDSVRLDGYDADLVLNQNAHATSLRYRIKGGRALLGPAFALLRPEFGRASLPRVIPRQGRRVVVTVGGADPAGVGRVLARGLAACRTPGLQVKMVAGPANPRAAELAAILKDAPFACELLPSVEDMPGLLAWADAGLCAAGVTGLEAACLGLPVLAVVAADNQEGPAAGLCEAGAAAFLGRAGEITPEAVAPALDALLADPERRRAMSEAGRALVDGCGAARTAEAMEPSVFTLVPAGPQHCDLVFGWANDPVARAASFASDPIPLDAHRAWYAARLADPEGRFFIALNQAGAPAGQVRFQGRGAESVVSVSLDPAFRGGGAGTRLLRQACLAELASGASARVVALIKDWNRASLTAFRRAGFRETGREEVRGHPSVRMIFDKESAA